MFFAECEQLHGAVLGLLCVSQLSEAVSDTEYGDEDPWRGSGDRPEGYLQGVERVLHPAVISLETAPDRIDEVVVAQTARDTACRDPKVYTEVPGRMKNAKVRSTTK